ncbi:MAG TPA: ATP-binding protein, partial [Candidatus Competibacteraceae bacterium]|nr:ATP-binding protein [Candidatus Competibacteraceae bacterium]
DGELLCNARPLTQRVNVADRRYFQRAITRRDFAISTFQLDRAAGVTSINFAYPVIDPDSDRVIAVAVAVLSLNSWNRRLAESDLPEGAVTVVSDTQNTVLAHFPEAAATIGRPLAALGLDILTASSSRNGEVLLRDHSHGQDRLIVQVPLFEIDGLSAARVGMVIPLDIVYAWANRQLMYDIALLLSGAIFILLLADWGTRRTLSRPLDNLLRAMQSLATDQHLASPPPVPVAGGRELAELAKCFNSMARIRYEVEDSLRESEHDYRTLADSTSALIWTAGVDALCNYFNRGWLDFTGRSLEQECGMGWVEGVHPDDLERCTAIYLGAFERRERFSMDYRLRRHDGEYRWIQDDGCPRYDRAGQFIGYIGYCLDITVRKQVEDEVRRLNAELEERVHARTAELMAANKELETFSYSVSHDLKAPLRGIDGYSQLLLAEHAGQLDEEGRLFLARIRNGVGQMRTLIDALLDYSRMERCPLQAGVAVDLRVRVEALLAEQRDELQACGAEVSVDIQVESVRADPNGLAMVLRNLFDNALKFSASQRPPRIEIRAWSEGERVMLSLSDNGIGFDMRFHDRLFEIFQRLQRAEDYPGTGIGLAIVRKAMQRMGGRVWAESSPGTGATFFLEWPR